MSNNFAVHFYNYAMDDGVVYSSANTFLTDGELANLRNPILPFKVLFNSDTSAEIIFDTQNVEELEEGLNEIKELIIVGLNAELNATISIKANNTLSWGSPSFSQDETIQEDYDYSHLFSIYDLTGLIPSLRDLGDRPVRNLYFTFEEDLLQYRYIRILITVTSPVNPVKLKLSKIYLGDKLQTSVNFNEGWVEEYQDYSQDGRPIIGRIFKFTFETQNRIDARLMRYVMSESNLIDSDYCFISVEPENVNDWDEVRKHTLTMYGQLIIKEIKDEITHSHKYQVEFIEAVDLEDITVDLTAADTPDDPVIYPTDEIIDFADVPEPPPEGISIPVGTRFIKIKLWAELTPVITPNTSVFYDNVSFSINGGPNLLDNHSFETAISILSPCTEGWSGFDNRHNSHTFGSLTITPQDGDWFWQIKLLSGTGFHHYWLDVTLLAAMIDAGNAKFNLSGWYCTNSDFFGIHDRMRFSVDCHATCDSDFISTPYDSGWLDNYSDEWLSVSV